MCIKEWKGCIKMLIQVSLVDRTGILYQIPWNVCFSYNHTYIPKFLKYTLTKIYAIKWGKMKYSYVFNNFLKKCLEAIQHNN